MAELYPIPFRTLARRAYLEWHRDRQIYDMPETDFYWPDLRIDTGVDFHEHRVSSPLGISSGPHTQMAQGMILGWLGGARIFALKTVRSAAVDMTRQPGIYFDRGSLFLQEQPQELPLDLYLQECVKASMIMDLFRHARFLGDKIPPSRYDTVFDLTIECMPSSLQDAQLVKFVRTLRDAHELVEQFRRELPRELSGYKDMLFRTRIADSATLNIPPFCPIDETIKMARFLMQELELNISLKLDPMLLGKSELESILADCAGRPDLKIHPSLGVDDSHWHGFMRLMEKIEPVKEHTQLSLGFKSCRGLLVENHRPEFPGEPAVFVTGKALRPVALRLAAKVRETFGAQYPMGISAGVDADNFTETVTCGFVPVSVCTDILRPGGYSRLHVYLKNLETGMLESHSKTVREYIRKSSGAGDVDPGDAAKKTLQRLCAQLKSTVPENVVETPPAIPSCPFGANFLLPLLPADRECPVYRIEGERLILDHVDELIIEDIPQVGNFSDLCNECRLCPAWKADYLQPWIKYPAFYSSLDTFLLYKNRDGFYAEDTHSEGCRQIWGRIKGAEYYLEIHPASRRIIYRDEQVEAVIDMASGELIGWDVFDVPPPDYRLDFKIVYSLRLLLEGVLDQTRYNYINITEHPAP